MNGRGGVSPCNRVPALTSICKVGVGQPGQAAINDHRRRSALRLRRLHARVDEPADAGALLVSKRDREQPRAESLAVIVIPADAEVRIQREAFGELPVRGQPQVAGGAASLKAARSPFRKHARDDTDAGPAILRGPHRPLEARRCRRQARLVVAVHVAHGECIPFDTRFKPIRQTNAEERRHVERDLVGPRFPLQRQLRIGSTLGQWRRPNRQDPGGRPQSDRHSGQRRASTARRREGSDAAAWLRCLPS